MIKCVAMAVYYHIYNRKSEVILDIFDERLYPLGVMLLCTNLSPNLANTLTPSPEEAFLK